MKVEIDLEVAKKVKNFIGECGNEFAKAGKHNSEVYQEMVSWEMHLLAAILYAENTKGEPNG